jgi:hypothetical protein
VEVEVRSMRLLVLLDFARDSPFACACQHRPHQGRAYGTQLSSVFH